MQAIDVKTRRPERMKKKEKKESTIVFFCRLQSAKALTLPPLPPSLSLSIAAIIAPHSAVVVAVFDFDFFFALVRVFFYQIWIFFRILLSLLSLLLLFNLAFCHFDMLMMIIIFVGHWLLINFIKQYLFCFSLNIIYFAWARIYKRYVYIYSGVYIYMI